ncbi:hypothetical protein D3C83_60840 [compost metagenome]
MDAGGGRGALHGGRVGRPARQIPLHVQRHRGAGPGELMDQSGIGQFFVNRDGRGRLVKHAEPRARVRESPRRQFDPEAVQRVEDEISQGRRHGDPSVSSVKSEARS